MSVGFVSVGYIQISFSKAKNKFHNVNEKQEQCKPVSHFGFWKLLKIVLDGDRIARKHRNIYIDKGHRSKMVYEKGRSLTQDGVNVKSCFETTLLREFKYFLPLWRYSRPPSGGLIFWGMIFLINIFRFMQKNWG